MLKRSQVWISESCVKTWIGNVCFDTSDEIMKQTGKLEEAPTQAEPCSRNNIITQTQMQHCTGQVLLAHATNIITFSPAAFHPYNWQATYHEVPAWPEGMEFRTELWPSEGAEGGTWVRRHWNPLSVEEGRFAWTFELSCFMEALNIEPWKKRRKTRMINREEQDGLWWRAIIWSLPVSWVVKWTTVYHIYTCPEVLFTWRV